MAVAGGAAAAAAAAAAGCQDGRHAAGAGGDHPRSRLVGLVLLLLEGLPVGLCLLQEAEWVALEARV
jgi:hypothetical protein